MDTLGEDLVLLSIRPGKARLATFERIGIGLMGAELVRLAEARRIEIRSGEAIVVDHGPLGDAELDQALLSLVQRHRPAEATLWVGVPRPGIKRAYLDRLGRSGVIRGEPGRLVSARWFIVDQARLASARARLDAIAFSAGRVSTAQAALGGLAGVIGLGWVLYPGPAGRAARNRLSEVGAGQWTVSAVTGAIAGDAATFMTQAAVDAVRQAAIEAAVRAAVHAATHANVDAASHSGGAGGRSVHGGHGGH